MHLVLEMPGKAIILALYLSITKSLFGEGGGLTAVPLLNYKLLPAEWLGGWKHFRVRSPFYTDIISLEYLYMHIWILPDNSDLFGSSDREILPGKYCMINPKRQHQARRAQATPRCLSTNTSPQGHTSSPHGHHLSRILGKKEQEKHPRCGKTSPWCPEMGGLLTLCARSSWGTFAA